MDGSSTTERRGDTVALQDSSKGKVAADVCIVIILMIAAFTGGLLVSNGGFPSGFPYGTNSTTTDTSTDTTTDTTTGTTTETTTTTTTLPDPPPDTTYKIFINLHYTGGLVFSVITEGDVVLLDTSGNPDDAWTIVGLVDSRNMTGISLVKRHTRDSTIATKIIIVVESKGWNYEFTLGSNWVRTPDGIGDYLQSFVLNPTANLECQVWLSPRWDGS